MLPHQYILRKKPPLTERESCFRIFNKATNRVGPMVFRRSPARQARIVCGGSPPKNPAPKGAGFLFWIIQQGNEPGRPNGLPVITGPSGPNCPRRLATQKIPPQKERDFCFGSSNNVTNREGPMVFRLSPACQARIARGGSPPKNSAPKGAGSVLDHPTM